MAPSAIGRTGPVGVSPPAAGGGQVVELFPTEARNVLDKLVADSRRKVAAPREPSLAGNVDGLPCDGAVRARRASAYALGAYPASVKVSLMVSTSITSGS